MQKFFFIWLLLSVSLLTTECKTYSDSVFAKFNDMSSMFSDSTKDSVYHQMVIVDDLLRKAADRGKFKTQRIGYVRDEKYFYFRHCVPKSGTKYVTSDQCNLDSLLSVEERLALNHGIEYLKSVGVRGCYHEHIFDKLIFMIDVPARDPSDGRYLCLAAGLDTAFVRKTRYDIIQLSDGLTLLKQNY